MGFSVASNRSGMSSLGLMSAMVIVRNSRLEKPYCRDVASFTARNLRVLRSKTHIGSGLLSKRHRYSVSDRRNASSVLLLRAANITPAAANMVNRIVMVGEVQIEVLG